MGEMVRDKERPESEEHERLRLARRVARLWSWDYRVDTNTVLWTVPEAQSDRTVQVTFEQVLSAIPSEDRERVSNAIQNTLRTGVEYAIEHRAFGQSGKIHWLAARGAVVSREPLRVIGVTVDICPLKQLQELQQIQRDATIAAEIAHSINNPLQVVVGALHLAKADIEGVSLEHVNAALDAARKVADAVRELTRRLDKLSK
ncbi:MAG TPA: PAS domain-containing protein [Candidatus Angelobacter sp.]|jgi:signal transduction histidine kinase|nr:PAS domain-containing protein [Candidatus Angelobacter sp.]